MSSSSAGKFQDHYSILGVDPRATLEAIRDAYTKASEKYHPDTPETGDPEKFASINQAYEVLTDSDLRREFDKLKGIDQDAGWWFSGPDFFAALGRGAELRMALLCVLYDRRRTRPARPSLSIRQVENLVGTTLEELNFALWYLKQRNLVTIDDKSSLQISADGVDLVETTRPSPEMVIAMLKSDEASAVAAPPEKKAESRSNGVDSVRNAMEHAGRR